MWGAAVDDDFGSRAMCSVCAEREELSAREVKAEQIERAAGANIRAANVFPHSSFICTPLPTTPLSVPIATPRDDEPHCFRSMANTLVDDRVGAVAEDADFIGAACEIFVIYFTKGADRQSLTHKNRLYVHFFSLEIRKVSTTTSAV